MSNELETQIEDDLIKDKVFNFFKKNKLIVFLLTFSFIVLPITIQVFFFYKGKKQEQFISKYIEAEILIDNNDIKGVQILNNIKEKGNDTIKLLAISKLAEYYINNNQKKKAYKILENTEIFNNSMFEELSEIKKVILSFDSINERFGIDSDQIKRIMKQNISFGSYKKWRERVKKFSKRRMHYK